jgi:opacity protein-like surface antigen
MVDRRQGAAGGSGGDGFTMAISHREGTTAILDVVRERQPPFSPEAVIKEVTPAGGPFTPGVFGGGSIGVRTRYIESVTGRLGWTGWSPQTMFYVRGGGAWVDTQLDMRSSTIAGAFKTFPAAAIFDTKYSGWTVGGGFEWMIFNNWSAFVEYNFYDFKSQGLAAVGGTPGVRLGSNIFGATLASDVTISTVTVGVNYRFNWARY